jgi:hypothetical protein
MVATMVLEAIVERRVGSSPTWGTKIWMVISAVEYFVDIEAVTGSIPVPSTRLQTKNV